MSKIVNNYQLGSEIGKGSFARVFKSINVLDRKEYAIKVIDLEKIGGDETLQRNLSHEIAIMRGY